MSRKTRTIGAGVTAAGCFAIALVLSRGLLHGNDLQHATPSKRLVMHEWGTFTSFSGSDGVNLEFRPLVTRDLPRFIMTSYSQPSNDFPGIPRLTKPNYVARQRMETPVTYFYTDVPRTVNVRVDFPRGMLSEWYPVVKQHETGQKTDERALGGAFLDWGAVRLIPRGQFANVRVRGPKDQPVPAALPPVKASDPYGHARETDSTIVETLDVNRGSHFEKFLFYRGLGDFESQVKLAALGNDRFEVSNSSLAPSGAMLLMHINGDYIRFVPLDPLSPQETREVELPIAESSLDRLTDATVQALVAAGLYEKEAVAMVNTWRTSWFGENGTRLLYLLPEALTEELLPLTIEPAPDERVRVLVGRLETLTPEDCQQLVGAVAGNSEGNPPPPERIKAHLDTLGRFAEPALRFAISQTEDQTLRSRLEAALAGIRAGQ